MRIGARRWTTTLTATSAPTPKPSSKRSTRPTRCSPTRGSAPSTTASATQASTVKPGAHVASMAPMASAASGTSSTPSSATSQAAARRGPHRGRDIETKVVMPFEEAAFGAEREVEVNRIERCSECSGSGSAPGSTPDTCATCRGMGQVRQNQQTVFGAFSQVAACPACKGRGTTITNPCGHCHGHGTERRKRRISVKIPAGVESGMQVRLTSEGDSSPDGGQSGNLYLTIAVNPHPFFRARRRQPSIRSPCVLSPSCLGGRA